MHARVADEVDGAIDAAVSCAKGGIECVTGLPAR